jgi:hypothetical protein
MNNRRLMKRFKNILCVYDGEKVSRAALERAVGLEGTSPGIGHIPYSQLSLEVKDPPVIGSQDYSNSD